MNRRELYSRCKIAINEYWLIIIICYIAPVILYIFIRKELPKDDISIMTSTCSVVFVSLIISTQSIYKKYLHDIIFKNTKIFTCRISAISYYESCEDFIGTKMIGDDNISKARRMVLSCFSDIEKIGYKPREKHVKVERKEFTCFYLPIFTKMQKNQIVEVTYLRGRNIAVDIKVLEQYLH